MTLEEKIKGYKERTAKYTRNIKKILSNIIKPTKEKGME